MEGGRWEEGKERDILLLRDNKKRESPCPPSTLRLRPITARPSSWRREGAKTRSIVFLLVSSIFSNFLPFFSELPPVLRGFLTPVCHGVIVSSRPSVTRNRHRSHYVTTSAVIRVPVTASSSFMNFKTTLPPLYASFRVALVLRRWRGRNLIGPLNY